MNCWKVRPLRMNGADRRYLVSHYFLRGANIWLARGRSVPLLESHLSFFPNFNVLWRELIILVLFFWFSSEISSTNRRWLISTSFMLISLVYQFRFRRRPSRLMMANFSVIVSLWDAPPLIEIFLVYWITGKN